jgi:GH18 family chitinase
MITGVYFETWQDWKTNLQEVDKRFNIVYLAFADPRGKISGNNWEGTGLSFSKNRETVRGQIKSLRDRGVKVMLSVGGATYPFPPKFDAYEMVKLANLLGCDGIDIDWEPFDGDTNGWADIIKTFHDWIETNKEGSCKYLSAAVWSTGCMQPREGDRFRGINIHGLVTRGAYLDWLNIMAYDSGPPSNVDPLGSFYTYRVYYLGPLVLGFQPGKMGWGDYLTTKEDVEKGVQYAANDGHTNGTFIWSYNKDDFANGVTRDFIVDTTIKYFSHGKEEEKEPVKEGCHCPWCGNKVRLVSG